MTARAVSRFAAMLAFLAGSAALANPPATSPRPVPRPAVEVAVEPTTALSAAAPVMSVRPKERPKRVKKRLKIFKAAVRTKPVPEATTGRKGALCGDRALVGKTIPPIAAKMKGCGLDGGVSLISVSGVALTQPAVVDCQTANALKTWIDNGVKPAMGKSGGGVAALQVAASYACRGRNNVKGAKVSEHGKGRAIDISAIILKNGTVVTVQKGWGSKSYGKALKSMRQVACGPFKTVLGPGSDRHHDDHFHFDTARRRGSYCR